MYTISQILHLVNYDQFKWKMVSDLKVCNILVGLKSGYPKYMCMYCHWEPRFNHTNNADKFDLTWPSRNSNEDFSIKNGIQYPPLIYPENISPPPLHIKLGLVSKFIQLLDINGRAMQYLEKIFKKLLSRQKIRKGQLNGPQIRKLFNNVLFQSLLDDNQKELWTTIENISNNFLGNNQADNVQELVERLISNYKNVGLQNPTYKIHLLQKHLDKFPENCGQMGEQQGEKFHSDFKHFEERFKGGNYATMIGDYLWTVWESHVSD